MMDCVIKSSMIAASVCCILAGSTARAEEVVSAGELETLKRMMREVISENKKLTKRVRDLEGEMTRMKAATAEQEQAAGEAVTEQAGVPGVEVRPQEASRSIVREQERLERRVEELEIAKTAQEEATRWIIRDAVSTLGSKINEAVTLGGTLEVLAGKEEDFSGRSEELIRLNTAQLDLEVQVNDWTLGSLTVEYVDGTNTLFQSTQGFEVGVDRINLDTAFLKIGDPQKFPPFGTFGRIILPFGISTGNPVADVLTVEDPLTIEIFEMRKTAVGFGLELPTPALTPATPPFTPPPVKPMVINPLIGSLSRSLGYAPPPTRPQPPTPITAPPVPPPFNAGVYFYDGNNPGDHIDATMGFRTQGHCGRPYDQLGAERRRWLEIACPWTFDVDVDFNTSVFDSRFLEAEYRGFLDQIGLVPGMAAHVKTTLGPLSLVGEWNGAIKRARFFDGTDTLVNIRPAAWQISLGYQFDWNPWVESIGAQGDYLAIGYSESHDLAGVTQLISGEPSRVGFVPKRRFLVGAGEWVLDGLRFAVEYSHNVDYSKSEGGTGNSANGIFSTLTYVW